MTEATEALAPATGLLRRLDLLRAGMASIVRHRANGDPTVADPLRGLYLQPDVALRWADRPLTGTDLGEDAHGLAESSLIDGEYDRLAELATRFALDRLDVHILLTALAPEIDRRFEPLLAFLNDDVSRRRATLAVTLELLGTGPHDGSARGRIHRDAPLARAGLLLVEDDPQRPLPGRLLRVPERVITHLLGEDALDESLLDVVRVFELPDTAQRATIPPSTFETRLTRLITTRQDLIVYIRERRPGAGPAAALAALHAAGLPALRYQLPEPPEGFDARELVPALVREARLRNAALVVGPLSERPGLMVQALENSGVPTLLISSRPFDPEWSSSAGVLSLELSSDAFASAEVWADELEPEEIGDLGAAVAPFRLSPQQVRRAVRSARLLAEVDDTSITAAHIQQGARQQYAPVLDQQARRIDPAVGWPDLVLPEQPLRQLHELVARARHRDRVLRDWRLRPGGGRGRGVVALFAGESGTGKTMSAEVIARELGVELYVVDLSMVADKYIGETEKNLEQIFTAADRTDAVLLFDEADAIFGKRSEVKSSHDRYANLESAFLLQRLEIFDGIAILTTNLRANIDEAFTRRLDLVVDFPFPDASLRAELWAHCLEHAPRAADVNFAELGAAFELSGGAIRAASVTSAYAAAARNGAVTHADALAGAQREYQKMGRVIW